MHTVHDGNRIPKRKKQCTVKNCTEKYLCESKVCGLQQAWWLLWTTKMKMSQVQQLMEVIYLYIYAIIHSL